MLQTVCVLLLLIVKATQVLGFSNIKLNMHLYMNSFLLSMFIIVLIKK